MITYEPFFDLVRDTPMEAARAMLLRQLERELGQSNDGNLERWQQAFDLLPDINTQHRVLNQSYVEVGKENELNPEQRTSLFQALKQLMPWRKGPYKIFDVCIDTEWRSDWKWDRLMPHIAPLKDKMILDVGCGSGYHCWRMAGEGARLVMGIDPSLLFMMQYKTVKKYAGNTPVFVFPFALEDMPQNTPAFDSVFSMGVLYHRRSPFDHLLHLHSLLKTDGELILETLIIEGEENTVLVPRDRYAMMRNVWFIPSVIELIKWLERCGYRNVRCVDVNQTSIEEQHSTEWMQFNSLPDFLHPQNPDLTIENYPSPRRAIILANK